MRLRLVNPSVPAEVPLAEIARRAKSWQVDAQPLQIVFEDDSGARPAAVLVTAEGFVLHAKMLRQVSPELGGFVAELEQGLRDAMKTVQGSPRAIEVRTQSIADALEGRLAMTDLEVPVRASDMEESGPALLALKEKMGSRPRLLGTCCPATWKAWGLPDEWISETFRLAAQWMTTRPWELLSSDATFVARTGSGQIWHALVLGSGGLEMGLALYSEVLDFESLLEERVEDSPQRLEGRLISLTYEEGGHLNRAMQREVRRAGWTLAGPAAYPVLFTVGCLGGGLSQADAKDLQQVLFSLARWAETVRENVSLLAEDSWEDSANSVHLDDLQAALNLRDEGWDSIPLLPGFAQGVAANPRARLEVPLDEWVEDESWRDDWLEPFRAALQKKALKTATVEAHVDRVTLFLMYLMGTAGVPLPALHEFDLLVFLFDWYPRKVADSGTEAKALLVSLGHFFRFLAQEAGISCPWSREILLDRETFIAHWRASARFGPPEPGEEAVDIWQEMEDRALVFGAVIPGVLEWPALQGIHESSLYLELQTQWLLWREELIHTGINDSSEVFRALEDMAAAWLQKAHPRRAGKTPVEVIQAERRERERRQAEWEERERP